MRTDGIYKKVGQNIANKRLLWLLVIMSEHFIYQYSETNVMQFLFNLLSIKDLYIFQALLAHPHEALQKRHLVCCVRIIIVGCTNIGVEMRFTPIPVQPTVITCTKYTKCRFSAPLEDEQVMLETAFHSNPGVANCHNTHAIYQVKFFSAS
jgi:hypothetical protein